MSLNRVYAAKLPAISRAVPEGTKSGDFLVVNGRPVVALTDREGEDKTETFADMTLTYPGSTSSNPDGFASLNVDGTYDLPVTGANGSTNNDVPVYYIAKAGGTPASLTLTKPGSDEVVFGYTNYPPQNYARKAGIAPVRIGA